MGACTLPGKCMIVTELLPKGDLETMLRFFCKTSFMTQNRDKKIPLSNITKLKMARDAAFGMNWLHCSNPVFIHRDLKRFFFLLHLPILT